MQKRNLLAATFISATVGLGMFSAMPSAYATGNSIIPGQEGEIETTNLGCLPGVNCIKTDDPTDALFPEFTVESLIFTDSAGNGFIAGLYADKSTTANTYGDIKFETVDEGTNPLGDQIWYRPVTYRVSYTDGNGGTFTQQEYENMTETQQAGLTIQKELMEGGKLEVGLFKFVLDGKYKTVDLTMFDIEEDGTGIVDTDATEGAFGIGQTGNNGETSVTLSNVSYFTLQLGNTGVDSFRYNEYGTGDGVRLVGLAVSEKVPEPSAAIGFGALALGGAFGLKKRKKAVKLG